MDAKEVLGANLRRLRQERELSQEELAARADLHRTYISSVERGERNISLDNIVKLARVLGVPLAVLLEGIDTENPLPPDN